VRASQLHKLNTHGENSAGQVAPSVKSLTQHGTDTVSAVIIVSGFGNIGDNLDATTDIGGGNVVSQYTVVGAREDPNTMATGLALDINGQTDHTAVAAENLVQIVKTTAGTVEVVSTGIS
jgi:hypothetical protein